MKARDDGEPAFPSKRQWRNDGDANATAPDGNVYPIGAVVTLTSGGMTLRDYLAAKAMQGMLPDLPKSCYGLDWKNTTARNAYELADAMLKERQS